MSRACEPINIGDKLLIHDADGHRVFLDPDELHMTVHMIENHIWEPHVREIIVSSLSAGGIYVDVGANIGLHALYAAGLVGNTGNIVCIEPNYRLFNILENNFDINGFLDRTKFYNMAASNYNGNGTMYIYDGHAGGSGLGKSDEYLSECKEQIVNIGTLDNILNENIDTPYVVDVLKIDVEGFELKVLQGASKVLDNPNITVILEWQPEDMIQRVGKDAPREVLNIFRERGFSVYQTNFQKSVQRMDLSKPEELLNVRADLVFTKRNHLNELIDRNKKKKLVIDNTTLLEEDIVHNKKTFEEILELQEENKTITNKITLLEKDIAHSKKAFEEAVEVQEQLKNIINKPAFKDLLRCIRNFLFK